VGLAAVVLVGAVVATAVGLAATVLVAAMTTAVGLASVVLVAAMVASATVAVVGDATAASGAGVIVGVGVPQAVKTKLKAATLKTEIEIRLSILLYPPLPLSTVNRLNDITTGQGFQVNQKRDWRIHVNLDSSEY
jgi:hypothetical protein